MINGVTTFFALIAMRHTRSSRMDVHYQSVNAAILELREATLQADLSRPATVKLPPLWPKVHAREEQRLRQNLQQSQQASRAKLESYPQVRTYAKASQSRDMAIGEHECSRTTLSAFSEVSTRSSTSPTRGELRKSSNLLNSPTTHRFASPSKSSLTSNNYAGVGEDSMFGTQVRSSCVLWSAHRPPPSQMFLNRPPPCTPIRLSPIVTRQPRSALAPPRATSSLASTYRRSTCRTSFASLARTPAPTRQCRRSAGRYVAHHSTRAPPVTPRLRTPTRLTFTSTPAGA